jgi:hypothetical protein
VGFPISDAALLAQTAAEDMATSRDGYVEVHLLLLAWAELPMARSAIARGLRNRWPARSQLKNDVRQASQGTFSPLHTSGLDPYELLMESHRLAEANKHDRIFESDLFAALAKLASKDLQSLGVRVDELIADLGASEIPDAPRTEPLAGRSVFVAYPWAAYQDRDGYKAAFTSLEVDLDVRFIFAESQLSQHHVLDKIEDMIKATSFGIYDLTRWNPNVTLEYGYARGLGRQAFIAFNPTVGDSTDVPADTRGYDRVQYQSFEELTQEVRRLVIQELGRPADKG